MWRLISSSTTSPLIDTCLSYQHTLIGSWGPGIWLSCTSLIAWCRVACISRCQCVFFRNLQKTTKLLIHPSRMTPSPFIWPSSSTTQFATDISVKRKKHPTGHKLELWFIELWNKYARQLGNYTWFTESWYIFHFQVRSDSSKRGVV